MCGSNNLLKFRLHNSNIFKLIDACHFVIKFAYILSLRRDLENRDEEKCILLKLRENMR